MSDTCVVTTDEDVLSSYTRDRSAWTPAGRPAVLVAPADLPDIRRVLEHAMRTSTTVVPRGAGSGLAGGANAVEDCIVLSLHRYDAIPSVQPRERLLHAQAGAVNADVKRAATRAGLWYPPDPASADYCTIGGNVATNAGGLCCIKYGVTREWVQRLEAVLPGGELLRTGHLPRKGVAGYDLVSLLVGSEGTLAVITDVTLRLRPPAPAPGTVVGAFDDLVAAGAAIESLLAAPGVPSLLEVLDRTTLRAVQAWKPMGLDADAAALVYAQYDSGAVDDATAAERAMLAAGATFAHSTTDPAEAELLLAARKLAYPALERLGIALLDDVAVPPSAVVDVLTGVRELADRHEIVIGTFGHAGDGNLHPTIVIPRDDRVAQSRAQQAFQGIVDLALSVGGTVTGEHGVGVLKRRFLREELDGASRRLHAELKRVFDPTGVLNPGKAMPSHG